MPELRDVEGYRRTFARHAAGKRVRRIYSVDASMLRSSTAQGLGRALKGRRFEQPTRHGKYLVCGADGPTLVLHFGMTGSLVWSGDAPFPHAHDRLVLELSDGELRYRNMRRLGGIWLAATIARSSPFSGSSGPTGSSSRAASSNDV